MVRVLLFFLMFVAPSAALSLTLLLPFAAQAQEEDAASWTNGQEVVTPEAFHKLIALVKSDPAANADLQKAIQMIGGKSTDDLLQVFSICNKNSLWHRQMSDGTTFDEHGFTDNLVVPTITYQFHMSDDPNLAADTKQFAPSRTESHPDYVELFKTDYSAKNTTMCIIEAQPLMSAFESFVHELRHFVGLQYDYYVDMSQYKDEDDFLEHLVLEPGQEVSAYTAEYQARIRHDHSLKNIPDKAKSLFDDNGNFVGSKAAMVRYVLDEEGYRLAFKEREATPDGRKPYEDRYERYLDADLSHLQVQVDFLKSVLSYREQRASFDEKSIDRLTAEIDELEKRIDFNQKQSQ